MSKTPVEVTLITAVLKAVVTLLAKNTLVGARLLHNVAILAEDLGIEDTTKIAQMRVEALVLLAAGVMDKAASVTEAILGSAGISIQNIIQEGIHPKIIEEVRAALNALQDPMIAIQLVDDAISQAELHDALFSYAKDHNLLPSRNFITPLNETVH